MLIEDGRVCGVLRQMAGGFTSDPTQRDDLMQECLINLWKVERDKPGRTHSWYLQNCRFHLQHCGVLGRSLDSPKRASQNKRLPLDGSEEEEFPYQLHTNGEVLGAVSFQDVVRTLATHLKPRERVVRHGLAEVQALS